MFNRKKKRIAELEANLRVETDQAQGWRKAHAEANAIAAKALADWRKAEDAALYWRVQRSQPYMTRNAKPMYDQLQALDLTDEEKTEPTLAEIEHAEADPKPRSNGPSFGQLEVLNGAQERTHHASGHLSVVQEKLT